MFEFDKINTLCLVETNLNCYKNNL